MSNTYQLPQTYYLPLLEVELVDEILSRFKEHELAEAINHLMESLDHAILEAILQLLAEELHEEFLQMLAEKYHDPALVDWLEEQTEGITPHIQRIARETKISIKELMDGDYDNY